jgi:hypothetical protein
MICAIITYERIKSLETQVNLQDRAAYLNSESLDLGKLTLGNNWLQFLGWQGNAEFRLASVNDIEPV